jgi:hypothetical protein
VVASAGFSVIIYVPMILREGTMGSWSFSVQVGGFFFSFFLYGDFA